MSHHGETEKERMHLTPAEFRAELKALATETKELVKVARRVGALKSGQHLDIGGEQVGAQQLNAMVTAHNRRLKQLAKNYTEQGKRKKRVTQARPGEGFAHATFLNQPLRDFLLNANFGTIPGSSTPLSSVYRELVTKYGILSRATVTSLLTIYEFVNGLRFVQNVNGKERVCFRVGPEMERYLGAYVNELEAAEKGKTITSKKGKQRAGFDRNCFVYNLLQKIVNPGFVPKESLTPDRLVYLENDGIKQELARIQDEVTRAKQAVNPSKAK
jgi:hypothetical protein